MNQATLLKALTTPSPLERAGVRSLKEEYRQWLQTLGFSKGAIKGFPNYITELLVYLKNQDITEHYQITAQHIQTFFFQWKKRKNKRTGAGLSASHISTCVTSIHNFIKFLRLSKKHTIELKLEREKRQIKIPVILSLEEIQSLYEGSYHLNKRVNNVAFGQRDRAMLAIYYGCGLRKNEGLNLQLSDIQKEKRLLFVRKGKGSKERFVPISEKNMQDIEEYLEYGRKWFLEQRQKKVKKGKKTNDYVFVGIFGEPMNEFAERLKVLKEASLISKPFTLHSLRHSIATHLLQGGMDIEQIRKFLGHASLESTQIYTHIINEQ